MMLGFDAENFEYGVPMIPKPKSEAWLLCAVKQNPYQHCQKLEDELSGNDSGKANPKDELSKALEGRNMQHQDVIEMIKTGEVDVWRIEMQSLIRFRDRLVAVIEKMQTT